MIVASIVTTFALWLAALDPGANSLCGLSVLSQATAGGPGIYAATSGNPDAQHITVHVRGTAEQIHCVQMAVEEGAI